MLTIKRKATAICSVTTKNNSGTLTDPATSMKITIYNPRNNIQVSAAAMTKDSTGTYHYDYTPSSNAVTGTYKVTYTATNGTRVSSLDDTFMVTT